MLGPFDSIDSLSDRRHIISSHLLLPLLLLLLLPLLLSRLLLLVLLPLRSRLGSSDCGAGGEVRPPSRPIRPPEPYSVAPEPYSVVLSSGEGERGGGRREEEEEDEEERTTYFGSVPPPLPWHKNMSCVRPRAAPPLSRLGARAPC